MKNKKDVDSLIKENRQLKRELEKAEKKLRLLSKSNSADMTGYISGKAIRYSDSNHYLGFVFRSLKTSNIYSKIKTFVKIFSKFRIVSFLVKIITSAIIFIETGAHVILLSTLALITLPISTVLGLFTFIIAFFGTSRANKRLTSIPENKNVFVFFPQNLKQLKTDNFFKGWLRELCANEDNLVIIVSPAFWKSAGFSKKNYYLHYRKDEDNVIMLRNYYFFNFRRNILKTAKTKSIYMIH